MKEQNILKTILLEVCHGTTRVWRSNVGQAWTGRVLKIHKSTTVVVSKGDVVIREARPFRAGFKGLSDLIGYESIVVTENMVGKKLAVFVAIEVKSDTGRLRPEQKSFIERVNDSGGKAGVARCAEDAREIIQN